MSELSMLNELNYNSQTIILLFEKEKKNFEKIYGNKWLLCTVINGKIKILQSSDDRGELEENGFKLSLNYGLFDVLNPVRYTNYKNHYSHNHNS
jgi:hypothetical protein